MNDVATSAVTRPTSVERSSGRRVRPAEARHPAAAQPPGEQGVRHDKVEDPGDPPGRRERCELADPRRTGRPRRRRPTRAERDEPSTSCAPFSSSWIPLMTRIRVPSKFIRGAAAHEAGDGVLGGGPGRGRAPHARSSRDPRPGEVLVRTLYTGISRGTESLVFRGEVPAERARAHARALPGGRLPRPGQVRLPQRRRRRAAALASSSAAPSSRCSPTSRPSSCPHRPSRSCPTASPPAGRCSRAPSRRR